MSINSQFLYSYIDELIRSQWVPWSENVLSKIPPEKFHISKGFQDFSGGSDSTNRTRAGECYRLGLINSRLVNERLGKRSGLPTGWERVCKGFPVHTRLGYFSYIIGKAYTYKTENQDFISALNAIATVQILLISFKHEERWYSTVNIFNYIRSVYEDYLKRMLSSKELRYLTGAVFNTLDGERCGDLLDSYAGKHPLPSLYFSIRDSGEKLELTLDNFQATLNNANFNINSIDRHKAALFWINEDRGIYTRASHNSGSEFLDQFLKVDRMLASKDKHSLIHNVLESIYDKSTSKDLINTFSSIATDYPELLEEWAKIMATLERGVVSAIEDFEEKDVPEFFKEAILKVKETLEEDYFEIEEDAIQGTVKKDKKQISPKKKGSIKKDVLAIEELMNVISKDYDSIFVEPPVTKEKTLTKKNVKRTIGKFDPAERDEKNKELGFSGEEFVIEVERYRLNSAGRSDLAQRVKWVSRDMGDGAGYDILSYDEDKMPIYIEVKTTKGPASTQFYLSENELQVSKEKKDRYRLYRVHNIADAPKIYVVKGSLDEALNLNPTNYRATVKSST